MKNLLFIAIFVTSFISASAQKVYFIYLQSENYSPFYVKMNDKIYSSATSGYLIISNLIDSTYNLTVGFPSSPSESRFVITINGKDRGFLIKYFDTGLGLFDLQNLTIINQKKEDSPKNISYIKRNDDFASLLSKAADDTSLLYAVVKTTEPDVAVQQTKHEPEDKKEKAEPVIPVDSTSVGIAEKGLTSDTKVLDSGSIVQTDRKTLNGNVVIIESSTISPLKDSVAFINSKEQSGTTSLDSLTNVNLDTASITLETAKVKEQVYKKSQVKRYSESSTSEGFGLVFFDTYEGSRDTIQLLIPNPPIIFKQTTDIDSADLNKNFLRVEEVKKDTILQLPIVVAVKNTAPTKSQCKSVASNNDFFKMRKNMAAENSDEAMVSQARKFFRAKCFTTEQIKNLSALFLTSAGKYQFFDAAYLHVSDKENFSSLESEIKDDYYLKRFKALIGE